MFRYLPEQASSVAADVDWIHNWVTDISVFFITLICGSMLYFAIRYRRTSPEQDEQTPRIEGNNFLEFVWTAVPTIISIFIAYYGVVVFQKIRYVPENAMQINVTAYKWGWNFQYENGKRTANEIYVPVNQPVKLVMTSSDVIHSFFVPAFRIKQDAVPGAYSYISFTAIKTGEFQAYCTEYCGTYHSAMLAKVHVVSEAEYERWLADKGPDLSPVDLGRKIYVEQGCNACHSLDGRSGIGPTWLQIYGAEREFEDGTSRIADDEYLRESIFYPAKDIVKGYANVMASYEGILTEEDVMGVIAFIKTLDGTTPVEEPILVADPVDEVDLESLTAAERGELWYRSNQFICYTCHSLDGTPGVGPTLKGIWMKEGTLADGSTYVADEEYLIRSIKYPNEEIVAGYPPAMPVLPVSDDQIADLIEFMKTLE